MKIFLCSPRGFCAGVVRAIETVEKALKKWGPPIYVKHEIVHNKHVVDYLKNKGAIFIEEIENVPRYSKIIYSAHGVSPEIRKKAKELDLFQIDATCVLVMKLHDAARHYYENGYKIILIGHKNHVEIIGTAGQAPGKTTIIETVADVNNLKLSVNEKIFYLTQTTLSIKDVEKIMIALKEKYPHIETLSSSSICYATTNRQKALESIMDKVDLAIIVGDPASSNSNRLKEVALKKNKMAFLINSEKEIDPLWFENVKNIAMTAGASTPEYIVQNCIDKLKEIGVNEVMNVSYTNEAVVFPLPKEVID